MSTPIKHKKKKHHPTFEPPKKGNLPPALQAALLKKMGKDSPPVANKR